MVSDIPYTMERMKQMANDTSFEVVLPALRGQLRFRIEEKDKSKYTNPATSTPQRCH